MNLKTAEKILNWSNYKINNIGYTTTWNYVVLTCEEKKYKEF